MYQVFHLHTHDILELLFKATDETAAQKLEKIKIRVHNNYPLLIYEQTVKVSSITTLIGKIITSIKDKTESYPGLQH